MGLQHRRPSRRGFLAATLLATAGLAGCGTSESLQGKLPTTRYFVEFTDSDGTTSTFHCSSDGVDPRRPVGALVRLHGDIDDGYSDEFDPAQDEGSFFRTLAAVAARHNLLLIAPRTPDDGEPARWWEDSPRNSAWLRALLDTDDFRALDRSRLSWCGYSGGAEFLTTELMANHPEWLHAGALMIGGGGPPESPFDESRAGESLRHVPLRWTVGSEDVAANADDGFDALGAARAGRDHYASLGATRTSLNVVPGVGHLDLDQLAAIEGFLAG